MDSSLKGVFPRTILKRSVVHALLAQSLVAIALVFPARLADRHVSPFGRRMQKGVLGGIWHAWRNGRYDFFEVLDHSGFFLSDRSIPLY